MTLFICSSELSPGSGSVSKTSSAGGRDVTAFERLGQGLQLYQVTAPDVNQDGSRLHAGQRLFVDDAASLFAGRAVQSDDVTFGQ